MRTSCAPLPSCHTSLSCRMALPSLRSLWFVAFVVAYHGGGPRISVASAGMRQAAGAAGRSPRTTPGKEASCSPHSRDSLRPTSCLPRACSPIRVVLQWPEFKVGQRSHRCRFSLGFRSTCDRLCSQACWASAILARVIAASDSSSSLKQACSACSRASGAHRVSLTACSA